MSAPTPPTPADTTPGVEVLAPVRLETRFVAPADRTDGVAAWQLRLRIYPDEFSIRRTVVPPSSAELDRLTEAVAGLTAVPAIDEPAAFARFAAAVGAARALALWRRWVIDDGAGGLVVDRSGQAEAVGLTVHGPAGLPPTLDVWLVQTDGTPVLATTLTLDLAAIGADLDLESFAGSAELAAGTLPDTWWLSYRRAVEVGLGVDLDLGATPPDLEALVVLGVGDQDAAELIDDHLATGRLAVLPAGTPTNTVEGEPTTDFGTDADTLYPLLHVDPGKQQSTIAVLNALTGRLPDDSLPMIDGEHDSYGPGSLAVQAFWPVLWGRSIRDVLTITHDIELARWASHHLAVEGSRPAIRVGDQPYGLLPTSAYERWRPTPADPSTPLERRILGWGLAWSSGAAAAAEAANPWTEGTDAEGLLGVLGLHAPSRHWRARPVADQVDVQVAHILSGQAPFITTAWELETAKSWQVGIAPGHPIAPAAHPGDVPGPVRDTIEDPVLLAQMITMDPETLYYSQDFPKLGLVGHLFRESLIAARAVVGAAIIGWQTNGAIDLIQALPLDDEATYSDCVLRGRDAAVTELNDSTDADGALVAARFREVTEALTVIADLWDQASEDLFRATLAALDTASFRVDPWLTGMAERRLQTMISNAAPFRLGAYGWTDRPGPAATTGALAPGPTAAGLLHAPSRNQALTAALLRDAALRHPDDGRWDLQIDSAKVRSSIALAERVRLGVHPYEALGLEVEAVTGDWDDVRVLRDSYPLADGQDGRRVCDGAAVLAAARAGTLVAGLPGDLATRLAPLDNVLDTYADLLIADGVHALVTGRADLANAAMEAAAGLGAPPELRAIRTARSADTVRIAAWAMLPEGDQAPLLVDTDPTAVADPALVALISAELGVDPSSEDRQRVSDLLGGGERDAPVPSLVGGAYEGLPPSADDDLQTAMIADLDARLTRLRQLTVTVLDAVTALDPDDPGTPTTVASIASRWGVDLSAVAATEPTDLDPSPADLQGALATALSGRLGSTAAGGPPPQGATAVNLRRTALRAMAGDETLPILPVVPSSVLPTFRSVPDLDQKWLEIVAAARLRLATLEAHQLLTPWPAVIAAPDGSVDPWHAAGPILIGYGPAAVGAPAQVALAAIDGWTDSVPSRRHATAATFGFNAPKSRAPQAVLLAVPPDPAVRLDNAGLLVVVLQTRQLVHARAARPTDRAGLPYATPAPLVHASPPVSFFAGWPS